MLIIPAVDLRGGRCVRLVEGRPDRETVYDTDPVSVARRWERRGAPMLHVVDLDGALSGQLRHGELIAAIIRAVSVPVQVGGGIRDTATVERLLGLGAARVVLGSAVLRAPEVVREVCARHPEAVVAAVDARGGRVALRGWRELAEVGPLEVARRVAGWGVRRILYTDVARDGTLGGPDVETAAVLVRETGLKVIAAGGIASLEDLRRLSLAGVEGAVVGKALYDGSFSLEEALATVGGSGPC
ncbi:MAG: 1-(5-phosphoribosyl)-5-[(5-phosphoribosylamino)methylideneamino]imidazole-4-carboxamide isomerase [Firmicutes bacterium]|nr:1-(5-phosphoribosyl)-5-[(5-phosphoribosylamino)methylideneamino]imidazole-4-carboxamide isomerase [Bacillota bacterium]